MIYSSPWTLPLLIPSYFALASLVVLILPIPTSPLLGTSQTALASRAHRRCRRGRVGGRWRWRIQRRRRRWNQRRPSRVMWSGQVDRPYSSSSSPASSSSSRSSRSRYSASSGKKKSHSSSSHPPSIPPACCEWTHYTAPASTDAKSPSISTVMEVARSRNASGSTSRFVWTTCVVCPRFPLIFLAHSRYVLV